MGWLRDAERAVKHLTSDKAVNRAARKMAQRAGRKIIRAKLGPVMPLVDQIRKLSVG